MNPVVAMQPDISSGERERYFLQGSRAKAFGFRRWLIVLASEGMRPRILVAILAFALGLQFVQTMRCDIACTSDRLTPACALHADGSPLPVHASVRQAAMNDCCTVLHLAMLVEMRPLAGTPVVHRTQIMATGGTRLSVSLSPHATAAASPPIPSASTRDLFLPPLRV